jgi:hypothetical protein
MRVTSSATLPSPMTATLRASSGNSPGGASGLPQYQETKSVADVLPGRSSPGMPSRRSTEAPLAKMDPS